MFAFLTTTAATRKHLKLKGSKYCKKVFKKLCMMTSLCHGTLASALALQGVALALAWPWECSDGLGLGVCGLVNIPDVKYTKSRKFIHSIH